MTPDRRVFRECVRGLIPSIVMWSMLLSTMVAVMHGCAAAPTPAADGVPEDGVIAAGVVVGPGLVREIEKHPEDWPVQLRPGRAIILADGSLRADVGPSLDLGDRPGVSRHLRRAQLAGLWRELDELGLGIPEAGNFEGNPRLLKPGRREVLQVLECRRDGRDWIIVHRFEVPPRIEGIDGAAGDESEGDPTGDRSEVPSPDPNSGPTPDPRRDRNPDLDEDPRLRAVIRRIAALAWAADLPPDGVPRYPERYDFGPDPWARYRQTGDTGS